MDLSGMVGVVLGAVLALAGGVLTERWKERREHRAAARLIWFELVRNWAILFGAAWSGEWKSQAPPFSDLAWRTYGERLALAGKSTDFLQLQGVYVWFEQQNANPDRVAGEHLLATLNGVETLLKRLGATARLDQEQRQLFDRPLAQRLDEARTIKAQWDGLPEDVKDALRDPTEHESALRGLPPELRDAVRRGGPP